MLVTCDFCGKNFSRNKREVLRYKHHYCCNECKYKDMFKGNNIEIDGDVAYIYIEYKDKIFTVIIDSEDVDKIKNITWCLHYDKTIKNFYVINGNTKQRLYRAVMNCPNGIQIDHINRNTLDNRKQNLRYSNNFLNSNNHGCEPERTKKNVRLRNIYYHKKSGVYEVAICYNGKRINKSSKDLSTALKYRQEMWQERDKLLKDEMTKFLKENGLEDGKKRAKKNVEDVSAQD